MQFIGKSKISPLYSKGGIIYPQIRLPQQYNDIIGEIAHIFETEYDGKRAFFILTRELEEKESKFFKRGNTVLKPEHKVLLLARTLTTEKSQKKFLRRKSTGTNTVLSNSSFSYLHPHVHNTHQFLLVDRMYSASRLLTPCRIVGDTPEKGELVEDRDAVVPSCQVVRVL